MNARKLMRCYHYHGRKIPFVVLVNCVVLALALAAHVQQPIDSYISAAAPAAFVFDVDIGTKRKQNQNDWSKDQFLLRWKQQRTILQPIKLFFHRGQQLLSSSSLLSLSSSSSETISVSKVSQSQRHFSVELIDPKTGCKVVLVGCFHGSQSSAQDVEYVMTSKHTDVVVLELCTDRFEDLRQRRRQEQSYQQELEVQQKKQSLKQKQQQPRKTPWIIRYVHMINEALQSKGVSTATAVAVLGCISQMQTALSGLQPGLEFTTALRIAEEKSVTSWSSPTQHHYPLHLASTIDYDEDCTVGSSVAITPRIEATPETIDVMLADQSVDVTIYKLGQIPKIASNLWIDFLSSYGRSSNNNSWSTTFGIEAQALYVALFGCSETSKTIDNVQLPTFLTRSDASIRDLFRLTIPPLIIWQGLSMVIIQLVTGASRAADTLSASTSSTGPNRGIMSSVLSFSFPSFLSADSTVSLPVTDEPTLRIFVANAIFVLLAYMSVALPAVQVILRERDDQLTEGIRMACQLAARKAHNRISIQQQQQQQHSRFNSTSKSPEDEPLCTEPSSTPTNNKGRVVAVLGLLHINGIAQRLLLDSTTNKTATLIQE